MVVPFTYNILKRHPALMVMIHRADEGDAETGMISFSLVARMVSLESRSLSDPFLPEETDPMKTEALESSLWELLSHGTHYHAPVSTMCKIFLEAFTKPNYAMEDFLDHTYNTVRLQPPFYVGMLVDMLSCSRRKSIEESNENQLWPSRSRVRSTLMKYRWNPATDCSLELHIVKS